MAETKAIELINLTKRFGRVVANDGINLEICRGEILAILGENGCGKTTLMNMISGIYFPDEGHIRVNGRSVTIRDPKDAYDLGIGMVHQHFKLVDVLTAAENIILGLPGSLILDMKTVRAKITDIAQRYGFEIDPDEKIYSMSVSQKQTVEILKVLYRGADILILDEPTAVLTPQETRKLFSVLRLMREDGRAIVIITHKLNEVMEISDKVFVMRRGRNIGMVKTAEASIPELTEMMVGKSVSLNIDRPEVTERILRMDVQGLTVLNAEGVKALDDLSVQFFGGEILGIAGVAGSGQREMLESIAGIQEKAAGKIVYYAPTGSNIDKAINITNDNAIRINRLGIKLSFVPEDRLGMGLVKSMGMVDNMMVRSYRTGGVGFMYADRKKPRSLAERIKSKLQVVAPSVFAPVSTLSGGNVQKVLVGREIASDPTVLMVAYPVRGLDIYSSYAIYDLLNEQKRRGTAVVCVGEDLDVLLELCDRILVLCGGRCTGIVDARTANKEEIGRMMTMGAEAGTHGE